MKKMKFCKTMSLVIAMMLVVSMICSTSAQAVSPRKYLCGICGGECTQTVSDQKGTPAYNAQCGAYHTPLTRTTTWTCDSCGTAKEWVQTGHYCTNNGGHYCWGACGC